MSDYNRISNLRVIGFAEGTSFLVLLLIAMPLKYWLGYPMVVKVVGWCHGVLFMLYILAVLAAVTPMRWKFHQVILALLASVVPVGTFFLDKYLRSRMVEIRSDTNY